MIIRELILRVNIDRSGYFRLRPKTYTPVIQRRPKQIQAHRHAITCPICCVPLQSDELWRNVVPENILKLDAIALQRYREIQVNELPEEQIIIKEEEEFDQQDFLECSICHILLYQDENVIQLCDNSHVFHYLRQMEERQRDMDNIPQIREDVEVINNVQQIVVGKQPLPLQRQQQNEDRNMDPQDFTRCSICNTSLREAMNSNPELDRDREVIDNRLDAQQINLDDNQNMWQGRLRVIDMFGNVIRRNEHSFSSSHLFLIIEHFLQEILNFTLRLEKMLNNLRDVFGVKNIFRSNEFDKISKRELSTLEKLVRKTCKEIMVIDLRGSSVKENFCGLRKLFKDTYFINMLNESLYNVYFKILTKEEK
ncbi:1658_t:CDS:2, partial [Dentiscutata erythropus]